MKKNKRKRIQKKLLILTMSLSMVAANLAVTPLTALAEEEQQEEVKQEEPKQEEPKKEEPKQEESKKDDSNKEDSNKDDSNKDDSNKDDSNKDDSNKDNSDTDDVNKDNSGKNDADEDDSNKDDSNKDDSNSDDSNKDDSNKDDSNEDDSNNEDSDQDDQNKDDSNQEDLNQDDINSVELEDEILEDVILEVEELQEKDAIFARRSRATTKTAEVEVGESASLQSLKTLVASCPYCGGDLTEDAADSFRNVSANVANNAVLQYVNWTVGRKSYSGLMVPCMEMHFKGLKPGTSSVTMNYQANFERSSSSGYCNFCSNPVRVPSDYSWYSLQDTFNVVVLANYEIAYSANGDNVTNMPSATTTKVANETATLNVTSQKPQREGYEFLGWAESATAKTAQYAGGEQITLNWVSGSTTTKTLYAVWSDQEETSYKTVREYYSKGQLVAVVNSKNAISGKVGDSIDGATIASANPDWNYYTIDDEKIEFAYKGYSPNPFVLTDDTNQVITLRYEVGCAHDEVDYTDNEDGTHDGVCSDCHETVVDNEKHEYKDGYCIKCGAKEPEKECDHDEIDYTDNEDGTHDGVCSDCHETVVDNEKHEYKDGYCIKCGAKEPEKECDHENVDYTDNEDGTHDGVCKDCDKLVVDNEKHHYKDGVCTECGAKEPEKECDHENVDYTDNEDGTHDGVCKDCDKLVVDNEKHHYKDGVCTECGAKEPEKECDHENVDYTDNEDGTHDGVCKDCDKLVVDNEKHHYKDGVCTECGAKEPEKECDHENVDYTDNEDGTHDGVCKDCDKLVVDNEKHEYKDGVCIKCGAKEESGNKPGEGGNKPGEGGNKPGEGGNKPGEGGNKPGQGGGNDGGNKKNDGGSDKGSNKGSGSKHRHNKKSTPSINPTIKPVEPPKETQLVTPGLLPVPVIITTPETGIDESAQIGPSTDSAKPSNTSDDANKKASIPKTGDESNIPVMYGMLFGCGALLAVLVRKKVKDAKKEL